jgi:hypothetical protein
MIIMRANVVEPVEVESRSATFHKEAQGCAKAKPLKLNNELTVHT